MDEKVKSKEAEAPHRTSVEGKLDKGLEDTFPASDVPASTQPGSDRPLSHEAPDAEEIPLPEDTRD